MTKSKQIDLEEAIAKTPKRPQAEITDAFTGVVFQPKTRNHYEIPDPVPFAPNLEIARPTVRQRVENLLSRGIDPIHDFMRQQADQDELSFDVPDDPEAPLTPSEQNFLDITAAQLAEQAPLPDDGLPRPEASPPVSPPEAGDTPGGGGTPAPGGPPKAASPGPLPGDPKSVPTR